MWKAIAPVLVVAGIGERIVGLAGLPDDLAAWQDILNMIPDEVFGGAVVLTALFAWQRWGDRVKSATKKAAGRAGRLVSTIKIRGTDYIRFDDLIDVVSEVEMKPLGADGGRYGTLPDGTNIVTMADGTVRLALPVYIGARFRGGSPTANVSFEPAQPARLTSGDSEGAD